MKNPLCYQMTEYDCGPTSLLNAVSFLFEREQIPPELVRSVMLFCLDCFGADGAAGKCGTSCMAMQFLCSWLEGFGRAGHLPVRASYLSGRDVHFSANGRLRDALRRGGAAVVRLDLEGAHYVLLTGIEGDEVSLFDPYAGGPASASSATIPPNTTASFRCGILRGTRSMPWGRRQEERPCCCSTPKPS